MKTIASYLAARLAERSTAAGIAGTLVGLLLSTGIAIDHAWTEAITQGLIFGGAVLAAIPTGGSQR